MLKKYFKLDLKFADLVYKEFKEFLAKTFPQHKEKMDKLTNEEWTKIIKFTIVIKLINFIFSA